MKLFATVLPFGRSRFVRSGNRPNVVIEASGLLMKIALSLTLLLAMTTIAFAQGKLLFDINSDNLIYFTTDTNKLLMSDYYINADNGFGAGALPIAGSSAYTGDGLNNTPGTIASLAGAPSFIVALYGGTSAGSLSLQTTTTISDVNNPGGIVGMPLTFTNLPAGTPAWFQVQVYDSRATSAAAAWATAQEYAGQSPIFQATPQASVYAPLWDRDAPVNSTWEPGTFEPTDLVQFGGGYYGGIVLYGQTVSCFGGCTLEFANSNSLLIYFTTNTAKLVPADRIATAENGGGVGLLPIAGSGLYTGPRSTIAALSGSPTIIAALYAGSASNSLSLMTTTTIQGASGEGCVVPVGFSVPYFAPVWFQVQVFDSRANAYAAGGGAADAWAHTNLYAGASQMFRNYSRHF